MKRLSVAFLQASIVLVSLVVLTLLIRLPLTEGRAANLDLLSIYSDKLILYSYAASIAFFSALYRAFQLLGYIRQNSIFSPSAVRALKSIKYCALVLSVLIVAAGIYIRLFHDKEDDPAGFLAMCIVTTFMAIVVAAAAAIVARILQQAVDMKSENDLTI